MTNTDTDAGFTPGPWGAFPYYYTTGDGTEKRLVGRAQFETVAEVRMGRDDLAGDLDANAHLIAAAPALYEALRRVMDTYGFDPSIDSSIWNEASNALLQAQGHLNGD